MKLRKLTTTGLWICMGGALSASLLAACGGSDTDDCRASHSCTAPEAGGGDASGHGRDNDNDNGEGGGSADGEGAGGEGAGGAGERQPASEAGAAGASAEASGNGGSAQQGCRKDSDCNDDDASNGRETCVAAECRDGNPPPRVVSITPEDGATDVATNASVVVTFSEPLDPATATAESFKLFAGETEVVGTFKLAPSRDRMTFTPDAPLELWERYRVEVSREVSDSAGEPMTDDFIADFQARDGAWSVTKLAQAAKITVPPRLPQLPNGAVLASWLVDDETQCSAHGSWLLRDQSRAADGFQSATMDSPCADVYPSVAHDGGAVVGWTGGGEAWAQWFQDGAWADVERPFKSQPTGIGLVGALAHDGGLATSVKARGNGGLMQLVVTDAKSSTIAISRSGPRSYGPVTAAFGADGNGFMVWAGHHMTTIQMVGVSAFDAATSTWGDTVRLPGSEPELTTPDYRRGEPSIALGKDGEAMVLWVDNTPLTRVLMASHYTPEGDWEDPIALSGELYVEPIVDAPALVFDGETFVGAWTGKSATGQYAAYVSRYDTTSGTWSEPGEPHVSELGESAIFMPRLGVDARRNLLMLWAIAGNTTKVAYQRYRAADDEWTDALPVPGVSFSEPTLAVDGRLPFAFAPNRVGALMFRSTSGETATLRLAQFY